MLVQALAFSSLALFTPCEKGPAVDGAIREGEYSRGVAFARPGGTVFFAADSQCLYAAWRSKARNNDPGGGMYMKSTRRDDKLVCLDDAIDLVLENPDTGDAFHLAINAGGNIFDRRRLKGQGWDNDWNCPGIKVESLARSGVWELEVAIPMGSLNLTGTRIGANVMRESPTDAAWMFCSGDPFDGDKIELNWSETVPCFHMIGVGDPASGVWRPELACVWTPEGAEAMAFLRLEEVDKGGAVVDTPVRKQKLLKSGMTLQGRHTTLSRASFRASVGARIHPGTKELYSDTFVARRGAKIGNVPPYAEFDLGMKASGVCLYYPGQNRARFSVVANGEMKSAAVTVAGRTASLKVQPDGIWTALIDVPDEHGPFEVSFVVDDERYANVCKIEKNRFGWENNAIGRERVIVPPFKPIRAQGKIADVLLRKYAFDGAGLLASVKALDREILAAPVHFEVTRGTRTEVLEPTGSGTTVSVAADGCDATFTGSSIASKLGFKCRGRLEYDGFIWNEMTVTSGDTVDRLTLVIPMKDDEASLMHIVAADTIRHNPSGSVPQGDGVVFDSSTMYRKPECAEDLYPYSVVPYAWLGGPECGLSWFVNDAKGMALDTRKGAVRIVRRGGVLRLECDFVNRPTKLSEGHRLTFGFEATPVKRADPELRRHLQNSTDPVPEGMVRRLGVNWKATAFSNHWARVPWQGDWSKFDAANARPDAFTFKYSDPALAWKDEADTLQYQSEWVSRGTGYEGARRIFLVPSAIDFVLYRFNEWMDHGLEGLYFDDSYIIPCRNADTSGGHFGILETRELMKRTAVMQHLRGVKPRLIQVHTTNALLIPAFAFATSTLSWEDHYGEEPFQKRFPIDYVLAESMGTQIGCEGIVLDGCRRKKSPKDGWDDKLAMLTRSQLAILLPAGMSVWCRSGNELHRPEYLAAYATVAKMKPWDAATEFLPFWKKPVPVPEGVIGALYRRGKDELAVFGNMTDERKSFDFGGKTVVLMPYDYAFAGTIEPIAPSTSQKPASCKLSDARKAAVAIPNGRCVFYVDPDKGDDANDGQTVERPFRTLEQAVKFLHSGDTLHLASGATFRESLAIKSGGTVDAPIRILGHGATLTGREAIPDGSWIDKGNGLWLSPNRGYISACRPRVLDASGNMVSGSNKDPEFADPSCLAVGRATWNGDGVWFRTATGRHPREARLSGYFRVSGVVIKDASHIVVEDLVVENFSNDGVNVHGDSKGLVFRNIVSRNNGDDGFSIHDTVQARVEGLHSYGNDYGIQDIGTSRSDFTGSLIESNRIYGVDFHGGVRRLRETTVRDNGLQQIRVTEQKCKPGAADAGDPLYKAQVRLEKVTVTAGGRPSVYVEKDSRIVAVGCSFDGEIRKTAGGVFEEECK